MFEVKTILLSLCRMSVGVEVEEAGVFNFISVDSHDVFLLVRKIFLC